MKKIQFLAVLCVILLTISCRKHDSISYIPFDPSDTTRTPALFTDPKLQMMSDFENDNQMSMHGHLLLKSMQLPFPVPMLNTVFKVLSYTMEQNLEAIEMNALNTKLNNLTSQDSLLLADLASLSNQMNYNTIEILNQINNNTLNEYINAIMTAMGSGDQMGLRWFSMTGANFQNHVPGFDSLYMANYVKPAAQQFCNYHTQNTDLDNAFNGIHNLICPVLPLDTSCLFTYSRLLIGQFASQVQNIQNPPVNTYMFLEYFFYTLVTYQLEAATVKMNVMMTTDTLQAQNYWNNTVLPYLQAEAGVFLAATGYLMMNMAEYRSSTRWNADMQYAGLWMAPNNSFNDVLARAQFQVSALFSVLGITTPVIYGSIITPQNYCTGPPRVNVGGTSFNLASSTASITSRIPTASWNGNTCVPDNHWTMYNYAFGTNMGCQPWNISVIPTWGHSGTAAGYGTITPLWYNPRDPSQTSTSKTDSCTLEFAYFGLLWQWGVMMSDRYNANSGCMMNNNLATYMANPFGGTALSQLCGETDNSQPTMAPWIAQWHSDKVKWENSQYNYTRTFGANINNQPNPFKYNFSVTFAPYSNGTVFVMDQVAVPLTVPNSLPNGDVELWTAYTTSFQFNPTPNVHWGNFKIGLDLFDGTPFCQHAGYHNSQPDVFISSGELVNWGNTYASDMGVQNSFTTQQISCGSHTPNYQYSFTIEKTNYASNFSASISLVGQIIFRGYYGY